MILRWLFEKNFIRVIFLFTKSANVFGDLVFCDEDLFIIFNERWVIIKIISNLMIANNFMKILNDHTY